VVSSDGALIFPIVDAWPFIEVTLPGEDKGLSAVGVDVGGPHQVKGGLETIELAFDTLGVFSPLVEGVFLGRHPRRTRDEFEIESRSRWRWRSDSRTLVLEGALFKVFGSGDARSSTATSISAQQVFIKRDKMRPLPMFEKRLTMNDLFKSPPLQTNQSLPSTASTILHYFTSGLALNVFANTVTSVSVARGVSKIAETDRLPNVYHLPTGELTHSGNDASFLVLKAPLESFRDPLDPLPIFKPNASTSQNIFPLLPFPPKNTPRLCRTNNHSPFP
jgi:hypothetical protein